MLINFQKRKKRLISVAHIHIQLKCRVHIIFLRIAFRIRIEFSIQFIYLPSLLPNYFFKFKICFFYSPKTVRNAYGLLHASLQMFAPDFVYRISLPQKIKSSFYVPDENEIKVIYKLIKNTELEIPFLLASQCGLRPSEICALTKDCITADGLEIRKAVVINEHGREVYKPPKSYAGYRTIPISPLLRDKLMNTPDKKRICVISSNKISRDWNSFLRKHGLHIFRFYSLRHYYASQALLLGIPQKYIAELMGHSSTDMIEKVYQHTFPSAMEEFKVRIADNIEKLFG